MVITYNGATSFKITFGDTTIAYNPVSKASKEKQTRFGANVALVSLSHADANGIENVTHGEKVPFVISGPGEYEVEGIVVRGFSSETAFGGGHTRNTIYLVALEGMNLCFLGYTNMKKLPSDVLEALETIDVLFVPVGGNGTLSASDAHELCVDLEPKIVIPTQYDNASLAQFFKEEGETPPKPLDRLTLKKKDLEGKSGDVTILQAP